MSTPEEKKKDDDKKDKPFHIVVNGQAKTWNKEKITFDEVVILAFGSIDPNPNIVYTVTFKNGADRPRGTMVKGDILKIKNGTVFNATATDKS